MTKRLFIETLEARRLLATFVVNATNDLDDGSCSIAHCSLREAIHAATSSASNDTIRFAIPGDTPHRIQPTQELPIVPAGTNLDASTQTGYAGTPVVELDGSRAGNAHGLRLYSGSSQVQGLSIHSWQRDGIAIRSSNNAVRSNLIGLDTSGSLQAGNQQSGIAIYEGSKNVIGGTSGQGNTVSRNEWWGIYLVGAETAENEIAHNRVGTSTDGSSAMPNQLDGIFLRDGAHGNQLRHNVVSGNNREGILIGGDDTTANVIAGNLIGTAPDGSLAVPNQKNGIYIYAGATANLVGGIAAGDGNTIAANSGGGVTIVGAGTSGNQLVGNAIGLGSSQIVLGNQAHGIYIGASATRNVIGGPTALHGNTIVGNENSGIVLADPGTRENRITHNWIGASPDQLDPSFANRGFGVWVGRGASDNLIGASEGGNVIVHNELTGVLLAGQGTSGNQLLNNSIGIVPDLTMSLSNGGDGVWIGDGATNNRIGQASSGNTIASRTGRAIVLTGANTRQNEIQGNQIHAGGTDQSTQNSKVAIVLNDGTNQNVIGGGLAGEGNRIQGYKGGVGILTGRGYGTLPAGDGNRIRGNTVEGNSILGIDIGTMGRDPNDALDADGGANNLQNAPLLEAASLAGENTEVLGKLHSEPNQSFLIDLYWTSQQANAGEIHEHLGAVSVHTDANGDGEFAATVRPTQGTVGDFVLATATSSAGSTSDLSLPVLIANGFPLASVLDAAVIEGSGNDLQFEVVLSRPAEEETEIRFQTLAGTAHETADFEATSGNLVFNVGERSKTISVAITDDLLGEHDEELQLRLFDAQQATILRARGRGIILDNDELGPRPYGATHDDAASYMLGTVHVDLVFLESDRSQSLADDWSEPEIQRQLQQVDEGLAFWKTALANQLASANLDFQINTTLALNPLVSSEEWSANGSTEDREKLIRSYLQLYQFDGGSTSPFQNLARFNDLRRQQAKTDWAMTLFVADNSLTGWDISNLDGGFFGLMVIKPNTAFERQTVAHEVGHVFYAADEYPRSVTVASSQHYTFRSGYYNTQNLNAFEGNPNPENRVTSIMSSGGDSIFEGAFEQFAISPTGRAMVGWQDSDNDGIPDVLDVPIELVAQAAYDRHENSIQVTGLAEIGTLPNRNPWTQDNPITINRVRGLEYRVASGAWIRFASFRAGRVTVDERFEPGEGGRVEIRAYSDLPGVTSNSLFIDVPRIELSENRLAEHSAIGSAIGSLSLKTAEQTEVASFRLVAGEGDADNALFTIAGQELLSSAEFDYESRSHYSVRVRATDTTENAFEKVFEIHIFNVNEPPANIELAPNSVRENSPTGTRVGNLSTFDPDIGESFSYALVDGDGDSDNVSFTIAGSALVTTEEFDYEAQPTRSIRVQATDAGGLTLSKAIIVQIHDRNEQPTNIVLTNDRLGENQPVGALVGDFQTIDPDAGDVFDYELVSGDGDDGNALFSILEGSKLATAARLDHESQDEYSIRVRSTDAGGLPVEKVFTIAVTDANEPPTDIQLDNNSLVENATVGTVVGNLSAFDPDAGDIATFAFAPGAGDGDNALFTIDGRALRSAEEFDFESRSSYTVRVRATDKTGLTFDKVLSIRVVDANESPTDLTLTPNSVPENSVPGTTVGTLDAQDPDASESFSYALVPGDGDSDNSLFTVEGSTLKTAEAFNHEELPTRSVRIQVTDSGGGVFSKSLVVQVADANEAPTDIGLSNSRIAENLPAGTSVGQISAVDPDVVDAIMYSFADGASDAFSIVGQELRTSMVFDFESKPQYRLTIRATDRGGLSLDREFVLKIDDTNDSPTDIALSNSSLQENLPAGTAIGQLTAVDQDENDAWTYSFVSGAGDTDNASFRIESNELLADGSFDYEAGSTRQIRLAVQDSAGARFEKSFVISILDVDEYRPEDVNADLFVSPIDALLVVNHLNTSSGGMLQPEDNPRLDVNQDQFVTPLDALIVINYLNQQGSGEGEYELDKRQPDKRQLAVGQRSLQPELSATWFDFRVGVPENRRRKHG